MASISTDKQGRFRLNFSISGERRSVRLGRVSRKVADAVCGHVDAILTSYSYGNPLSPATAAWLANIGDDLAGKLAAVGLIENRDRPLLEPWIRGWIDGRPDIGPLTRRNMRASLGYLAKRIGFDMRICDVTPTDADRFRDSMAATYARATVGKTIKHCRQFFAAAMRDNLCESNPFAEVAAWAQENESRKFFVPREWIERLLSVEIQPRYRRLIALARYGGLRVPSEIVPLDWSHFDWDRSRFVVQRHKTATRIVPLFPELRAVLEPWREASGPVVPAGVRPSLNWRSHLTKLIARAELKPWPRLFHNLRASRETELVDEFPLHEVCRWLGNSGAVASRHYLTARDEIMDRAAGVATKWRRDDVQPLASSRNGTEKAPEFAMRSESGAGGIPPRGVNTLPFSTGETAPDGVGGDAVVIQLAGLLAEILCHRVAAA